MVIRNHPLAIVLAAAVVAAVFLGGCYSPSGGVFPHAGGPMTWYSTERSVKTVKIVDIRTNEEVFSIEVPPGKQLTIDFDKGSGDDAVNTPDLMRYEIMTKGTRMGTLHNAMTVPNRASRRIDVYVSQIPTFASAPPERQLRTDEVADRPDWWTPEGGPMPENRARNLYDD